MSHTPAVSVLTLGCRVNQYESDAISAALKSHGVTIVPFGEPADLSIVNTCTVTAESDRKSRQMIRRAAQTASRVIVTGCFAQIAGEELSGMENVSFVCGNDAKARLADIALSLLFDSYDGESACVTEPCGYEGVEMTLTVPMRTRSYIKIEDGCNNRCSYCLIRKARGPVRSKTPETVLEEARSLAEAGAKEVILTGIEAASYGMDFSNRKPYGYALAELIRAVNGIPGIERIGLGSLEPTVLNDKFVQAAAESEKLLPHFHLSVQSGSAEVLSAMRRRYRPEMILKAVERMRAALPEVTFSADIIVGFPGESEEDFMETVAFCRAVDFLHLHIFPYSKRAGTEAAAMANQIPEGIRRERASRLEAVGTQMHAALVRRYAEAHKNSPVRLLVEKNGGGRLSGHSEHFVELVHVRGCAEVGEIVSVLTEGTDGITCTGTVCR